MNSLNILTNEQQRRLDALRSQYSNNKDVIEWLQLELLWSQAWIASGIDRDGALFKAGKSNAVSELILRIKNSGIKEGGEDE